MGNQRRTKDFAEFLEEQLKDPEVRFAYEEELAKLHVGYEIAKMRDKLGLSQVELARKAKTTQPVISRIEQGGDVKISTLSSLANAMGVTMEFKLIKSRKKSKSHTKNKQD